MTFPTSTPSAQGVEPAGIAALVDALEAHPDIEPHGLIVQRHGRRIAEGYWAPHTPDRSRLVYSLSKTFTGTALGLQLGEGRLSLDDPVEKHFPDLLADADPRTRRMLVRHLASMATGHRSETLLDAVLLDPDDVVGAFFRIAPDEEPGTVFAYNQPPVLALATVLQRLAGERLADYLRPRVLDPIGAGDLRCMEYQPGIDVGFTGVYTSLDTVARLGQLYLDDGVWQGRRLLPEGWVTSASTPQVANPDEPTVDWQQGYGFQLWASTHGYRGDGAYGQLMVVLPEDDAVVGVYASTLLMQDELDLVWAHLLPAMAATPLPAGDSDGRLAEQLATLALPTAAQRLGLDGTVAPPPTAAPLTPVEVDWRSQRTVTAAEIDGDDLVLHEDVGTLHVPLRAAWTTGPVDHISASAAVDAGGRVVADLAFVETPHRLVVTLDPSGGTFTTTWASLPLTGIGVETYLATMHAPTDAA